MSDTKVQTYALRIFFPPEKNDKSLLTDLTDDVQELEAQVQQ